MRRTRTERYRLLAAGVVLDAEHSLNFQKTLAAYEAALAPRNIVERDLVIDIVFNRWRQRRMANIERAILDHQTGRNRPANSAEPANTQAGLAYRASVDQSRVLELFNRFESRYMRNAILALRTLFGLRESETAVAAARKPSSEPPKSDSPQESPTEETNPIAGTNSIAESNPIEETAAPPEQPAPDDSSPPAIPGAIPSKENSNGD